MSLYIRLQCSFWTHRKTLRLRAAIGDAAFWIPQRLWSYAAASQPDGDFTDYSAAEIALLVAYKGDAQALLEALQQAGWLDGMKIHHWKEHNEYHAIFSDRAKIAAKARWKGKESTRQDKKGKEASIASSMLEASNGSSQGLFFPKWASDDFKARFEKWKETRKAIGKKPKEWNSMFQEQLNWLEPFGETAALEILSNSIRNNYQGLFEPKPHGTNKRHPTESNRSLQTLNAGKGNQYKGVGRSS